MAVFLFNQDVHETDNAVKSWKSQLMWHSADVFVGSRSSTEMLSSDYTITYVAGSELDRFPIQIGRGNSQVL